MSLLIDCLKKTIMDNHAKLQSIESMIVRMAIAKESYRAELDEAKILKPMIAQAKEEADKKEETLNE